MSSVNRKPVATSPEDLERVARMYVTEELSIPVIAKAMGWPQSRVRSRLISAGVQLRSKSDALKLVPDHGSKLRGRARGPMPEETRRKLSEAHRARPSRGISVKPSGYIEYTIGEHKGRGVHVVAMESRIGRRLLPDEVVHHIDEDKKNNEIDNLALMTRSGHTRLHRLMDIETRERGSDGRFC